MKNYTIYDLEKTLCGTKKPRKKRETMLDRAIAGREVLAYVNGQCSRAPQSNLSHAVKDLGLTWDDEDIKFAVAVGAHRRYGADGHKMAIVKI